MATSSSSKVDDISIKQLQSLLGNISEEDCVVLIEEFGTGETDLTEVAQSVFEALDESKLHSVADLVWHIKKNPCFVGTRRDGGAAGGGTSEPWILARSRSSNNIQKHMNGTVQPRPASAAPRTEIHEHAQVHFPPAQAATTSYFGSTRTPIRIKRVPPSMDVNQIRTYLAKCMQDPTMNNLLHEIHDNKTINLMILMRGASGSGKSTLATVIWAVTEQGVICSADHYFMKNGSYKFNKNALGEAHDDCKKKCRNYLERGDNPIIVDNTNTQIAELIPYAQLAIEFNYAVKLLEPCTEWKQKPGILAQKNTHGVPKRTIEGQLERFEEITERSLVEKVLSRMEGKYRCSYNPPPISNWGLAAAATQIQQAQAAAAASSSVPSTSIPASSAYFPIGLWTPVVTTTMSSMSCTTPPANSNPGIPFQYQNPRPSTSSQRPRIQSAQSFSPPPPIQQQSGWTDPIGVGPPSPLLLSALLPDLSLANNPPKPKRSGKKNGNGNTQPAAAMGGAAALPFRPFVFEDPAHAAFKKLQRLFPTCNDKEKLEELFNSYEGDLDACAVALLEEGYMLADVDDEPEQPATPESDRQDAGENFGDHLNWGDIDNNEIAGAAYCGNSVSYSNQGASLVPYSPQSTSPPRQNGGSLSAQGTSDVPYATPGPSSAAFGGQTSSTITNGKESRSPPTGRDVSINMEPAQPEETNFDMILPLDFARLLLSAFGHPDDETRSLSSDELTIKFSADTAFELYKGLYLNMHKAENEAAGRNDSEESTRSNSPTNVDDDFNAIAISLCQMELETQSNDPQLAAIMDIESKIHQHTQESLRMYAAPNRTMAQNIKFCQLKQDYPFLDDSVINEVYTQCFLDDEKTRAALREMYPSAVVVPGPSRSSQDTPGWSLKYNPKDIKLYSTDELRSMQSHYDELEREWLAQYEKIRDYHQKCKNTSSPQIKAHYFAEAKLLTESMKGLSDEMQYYKAICLNAKHKNDQILDLHGLKMNGAMRVLKEFLMFKEQEFARAGTPKMILLIITGKGKHSKNGSPVLQPAVRNFLTQRQYKFHSSKPGTYTVVLTRGGTVPKKK